MKNRLTFKSILSCLSIAFMLCVFIGWWCLKENIEDMILAAVWLVFAPILCAVYGVVSSGSIKKALISHLIMFVTITVAFRHFMFAMSLTLFSLTVAIIVFFISKLAKKLAAEQISTCGIKKKRLLILFGVEVLCVLVVWIGFSLSFWYLGIGIAYVILIALLIPIIHGIFSYLITRKLIFPLALGFIIWLFELVIASVFSNISGMFYTTILDLEHILSLVLLCAAVALISFITSIITKARLKAINRNVIDVKGDAK